MHNINMRNAYITIDASRILQAIKSSKLETIGNIAKTLSVHRNTISDYLRGKTPVITPTFVALLELLKLKAEEVFFTNSNSFENLYPIALLIEELTKTTPEVALFLFGSRSRGDNKQFSDYDIGAYSQTGLSSSAFAKLHVKVIDWNEKHMTTVQIVNLNNADKTFLSNIRSDLKFLSGSFLSRNEIFKNFS